MLLAQALAEAGDVAAGEEAEVEGAAGVVGRAEVAVVIMAGVEFVVVGVVGEDVAGAVAVVAVVVVGEEVEEAARPVMSIV